MGEDAERSEDVLALDLCGDLAELAQETGCPIGMTPLGQLYLAEPEQRDAKHAAAIRFQAWLSTSRRSP
jgi:hypothetical protein